MDVIRPAADTVAIPASLRTPMSVLATAHPAAGLPTALRPPIEVALARAADAIPRARALPGGSQYEPKWDGFRLLVVRDGDRTSLWSRHGKDLTAGFPDLAAAAGAQIPDGTVVDGEAVIWADGRSDFDRLQQRLTARGPALARIARRSPAVFVGFDLLAVAGHDIRRHPLRTRRALLEELASEWTGALQLSPASTDPAQARTWFAELPATGIEGLVVKGLDQPYRGGRRDWVKVKHRDTLEVVCAAITGTLRHPQELIVGLPIDGTLRIVGRSTPLHAAAASRLGEQLRAPSGAHPWPAVLPSSALNRFGTRRDPEATMRIEPIVVEVTADIALSGTSFRHPVRYVRTRPELTPADLGVLARAS
ncbi:MAG: ATP-dependent DNA ligase [Actinomycetota bacterium]|nr:ATP-dependent DNA ligase [Actinomycetota bacterium]